MAFIDWGWVLVVLMTNTPDSVEVRVTYTFESREDCIKAERGIYDGEHPDMKITVPCTSEAEM